MPTVKPKPWQKHLAELHYQHLAKADFPVPGQPTAYTEEEIKLLTRFGHWMQALANGELEPFTGEQRHFIQVVRGQGQARTVYESAWLRMQHELKMEEERAYEEYVRDEQQRQASLSQEREAMQDFMKQLGIPESDEDRWW